VNIPKKPRQTGLPLFWAALQEFERLTQLERNALAVSDYAALGPLHHAKRVEFARFTAIGERLGLNRSLPELRERLEVLEQLEQANLRDATLALTRLGQELRDLSSETQNLRSFRDAYAGESSISEFNVLG